MISSKYYSEPMRVGLHNLEGAKPVLAALKQSRKTKNRLPKTGPQRRQRSPGKREPKAEQGLQEKQSLPEFSQVGNAPIVGGTHPMKWARPKPQEHEHRTRSSLVPSWQRMICYWLLKVFVLLAHQSFIVCCLPYGA